MSCYGEITGNEEVWVFYDVSGSMSNELPDLRAAMDDVIDQLVAEGIPEGNITEVDSDELTGSVTDQERYLQWFVRSADDYIVLAFINEAEPAYHGSSSDDGPTSEWTADYDALVSHLAGVDRFRAFIYGVRYTGGDDPNADNVAVFNDEHVPAAVPGVNGYPSGNDSLYDLGVRFQTSISPDKDADDYVEDIMAFLTGWQGGGVCERVRSGVSATVGSLLEATSVAALESQAQQAHFEGVDLRSGELFLFRESIAPDEVRSRFYPNPVTSEERLAEYAGSTKLGRMADAYPRARVADAQDVVGRERMTATELLSFLFEKWASEFPWFTYKSVPDLRYRKESGSYGGDGSPGDPGVLTVPAVFYPQDRDKGRRLSMRGIVDDILSIFAGTGVVQDSDGDIVLRPTYGPDAPTTPDLQLSNSDLFSRSTGDRPDPRRVYNQARGSFRGGEFVEEQQLNPPALALTGAFDLSGIDDETARNRERVGVDDAAFTVVQTFSPDVLIKSEQDTIQLEYTAVLWSATAPDGNNLFNEGSESGTIDGGDAIDLEFEVSQVITVTGQVSEPFGIPVQSDWEVTWVESGIRVRLLLTSSWEASNAFGSWYMAHDLEFDVLGVAYVQSNTTVEVDFGYDLQRDELIDADGNNALQVSQQAYGEREISVSTTAFAASPKQAQELVQALVMHHMEPRIVRRVEQSWSSQYKVLPDHIGRLIELPSTEVILAEQRGYADDYSDPLAPQLQSTWQGTLTQEAFTTEGLLAWTTGDLMRWTDGELVEDT